MSRRPLIVIPGRFSAHASAIRFAAIVVPEALADLVWATGGEPVVTVPREVSADAAAERLGWADGVLLPGGGDLDPRTYGEQATAAEVYDVHQVQDADDLALARWALASGVPLLAVCRGMQVVNVALGGSLDHHMTGEHRDHVTAHHWHDVATMPGTPLATLLGCDPVRVSCHHHQRVAQLGRGLRVTAVAADATPEALDLPGGAGWFQAVQWHPEDAAPGDPTAAALAAGLVIAALAGLPGAPRRSGAS